MINRLQRENPDSPVVVGGIVPEDANMPKNIGVAAVHTPKDFQANEILRDVSGMWGKGAGERRKPARIPRASEDATLP